MKKVFTKKLSKSRTFLYYKNNKRIKKDEYFLHLSKTKKRKTLKTFRITRKNKTVNNPRDKEQYIADQFTISVNKFVKNDLDILSILESIRPSLEKKLFRKNQRKARVTFGYDFTMYLNNYTIKNLVGYLKRRDIPFQFKTESINAMFKDVAVSFSGKNQKTDKRENYLSRQNVEKIRINFFHIEHIISIKPLKTKREFNASKKSKNKRIKIIKHRAIQ